MKYTIQKLKGEKRYFESENINLEQLQYNFFNFLIILITIITLFLTYLIFIGG